MIALVTLVLPIGGDAGPFNLFSNTDGYIVPFATNVSAAALIAGYTSTVVPDGTTIIRVKSTGICTNYINIQINLIPTTTTTSSSSTSSTTTTSTTAAPTTTTTTTEPIPTYCYSLTAIGRVVFFWIDVNGIAQFSDISNTTIYVCAQLDSIASTGTGLPEVNGGITICTSDLECTPTTTTTSSSSTSTSTSSTTTTTTTVSCIEGDLVLANETVDSTIVDVYAAVWVIATPTPVPPGATYDGAQGGTNDPISVDVTVSQVSCLSLYVNCVKIESIEVPSTGTYTFAATNILNSDSVTIILTETGTCL